MRCSWVNSVCGLLAAAATAVAGAAVVFETTSPYHHIRVVDNQGVRTLTFDQSMETRMSLRDPLTGHFEYTEYFHMPWLWNSAMTNVLMIGLGGGSTQKSYQHYYPSVTVETVDLDPAVLQVAKTYFFVKESPTLRLQALDGRVYLRRTQKKYDALIMDAYTAGRYGSFIPYHLVTKEFFELARDHLTDKGVVAYNVIGTLQGWRADLLGSIYKTMKSVFPQVYLFPANDSLNIVLIATKNAEPATLTALQQKANELVTSGRVTLPTFRSRVNVFRPNPPPTIQHSPILTDDYAPIDGLLTSPHLLVRRKGPVPGGEGVEPSGDARSSKSTNRSSNATPPKSPANRTP